MTDIDKVLQRARERAKQMGLSYQGALTPSEAHEVLRLDPEARLVDVRTRAEWDWVGKIPGSVQIEWNTYPSGQANPDFITELKHHVNVNALTLFICRSGARSSAAAKAATEIGYQNSYNVLEGFQGDKDEQGHRDSINGWRKAGLPWVQS